MKKLFCKLLLPFLIAVFILPLSGTAAPAPEYTGKQVDVLFLHDTHSHLNSFLTVENGQDVTLGGFAQIGRAHV